MNGAVASETSMEHPTRSFSGGSAMSATRFAAALIGAALLTSCSQTAVTKVPVATGGSKSDGTIQLAYERKASEAVTVDWAVAEQNALQRCQSWGYSQVDAFAGARTQCVEMGQGLFINGAVPGACAREMVFTNYQCLD
jgi:YecR-like lipoprotein